MGRVKEMFYRLLCQVFLFCIAGAVSIGFAQNLTLSVKTGPPTTRISVSGSGFPANTAVDLYFDTTDMALAATDSTGAFSKISIQVSASTLPGNHYVTGIARSNSSSAQAVFIVWTAWSQFGFNAANQRYNGFENVLSAANVSKLDLAWRFTTTEAILSSPALANGNVYVTSLDTNLYALNATTGKKLWTFSTGSLIDSSPAVAQGNVYFGSWDENFYALNGRTGAIVWSYPFPGVVVRSIPTVSNGIVYIPIAEQGGGSLTALNAQTGAFLWSVPVSGIGWSAPSVANGAVYVVGSDAVFALNATTGSLIWENFLPNCVGGTAVSQGLVYSSWPGDQSFAATSSVTGATAFFGNFLPESFAVGGGILYGSNANDIFGGVNARTGLGGWSFTTGAPVDSSPAIANGVVYAGSEDSNIYALDASNGNLLWNFGTGGAINSSPVVANGMLYVNSQDGNLYAFSIPSGFARNVPRPDPSTLRPDMNLHQQ